MGGLIRVICGFLSSPSSFHEEPLTDESPPKEPVMLLLGIRGPSSIPSPCPPVFLSPLFPSSVGDGRARFTARGHTVVLISLSRLGGISTSSPRRLTESHSSVWLQADSRPLSPSVRFPSSPAPESSRHFKKQISRQQRNKCRYSCGIMTTGGTSISRLLQEMSRVLLYAPITRPRPPFVSAFRRNVETCQILADSKERNNTANTNLFLKGSLLFVT